MLQVLIGKKKCEIACILNEMQLVMCFKQPQKVQVRSQPDSPQTQVRSQPDLHFCSCDSHDQSRRALSSNLPCLTPFNAPPTAPTTTPTMTPLETLTPESRFPSLLTLVSSTAEPTAPPTTLLPTHPLQMLCHCFIARPAPTPSVVSNNNVCGGRMQKNLLF